MRNSPTLNLRKPHLLLVVETKSGGGAGDRANLSRAERDPLCGHTRCDRTRESISINKEIDTPIEPNRTNCGSGGTPLYLSASAPVPGLIT